jgi:prolycopene isomerase
MRSSLAGVMEKRLADPRARAVYSALWPYAGLPPKRLSFGVWAIMMGGFIDHGAYYCAGGFQRLADAVAAGLVEHGGELVLGRRVSEIRVDRKRAVGVVTDEGELIRAGYVVATGDARSTFGALISPAARPRRTARRVRRDPTSMSVLALYVGTDIDLSSLGVAQETIVSRSWDHDANYNAALAGAATVVTVTVPTLADASLAPPGRHLVGIAGPAPRVGSQNARAAIAAEFVALAERVIPGLGDRIEFALGSDAPVGESPELTLHEHGPIYGWATTPALSGPFRLPQWTPIEGLYLAGHWSQPGHGIWTVMLSGLRAARLVLGRETSRGVSSPLL